MEEIVCYFFLVMIRKSVFLEDSSHVCKVTMMVTGVVLDFELVDLLFIRFINESEQCQQFPLCEEPQFEILEGCYPFFTRTKLKVD